MEKIPFSIEIQGELNQLFEADQAERIVGQDNIDFERMRENDKPRLARATEDYLVAVEIAKKSAEAGSESGAWLSAAAEDRYLLATGKKQKWGTQFKKENGVWEQLPMQSDEESGITDEMRAQKHVPARNQQMKVFLSRDDI